jgi:hypothetical protein
VPRIKGLVERVQVEPLEAADARDDLQGDGQCPGDRPTKPVGKQPGGCRQERNARRTGVSDIHGLGDSLIHLWRSIPMC